LPQITHALALAAARTGMEQVAQAAVQQTQDQLAKAADSAALARQAEALMRWGRNVDDAAIVELYGAWLRVNERTQGV
jgi:hypothetical protein